MEPGIHPYALKHLTKDEVLEAWYSIAKSVKKESDDEPPRWLSIGWLNEEALLN